MRNLIIIMACIFLSSCNDKEILNEYYDSGELENRFTVVDKELVCLESYYKSGQKREVGCFRNETKDGNQTEYYENGNVKSELNYINGKEEGVMKFYNENGGLYQEKWITNGDPYYSKYYSDTVPLEIITPIMKRDSATNNGVNLNNNIKIRISLPFDSSMTYYNEYVHVHYMLSDNEDPNEYNYDLLDSIKISLNRDLTTQVIELNRKALARYFNIWTYREGNKNSLMHSSLPLEG